MKKFVIIVLVFAALVFGSCGELQKGGTIKVTNESSDYSVNIYITKDMFDGLTEPPTKVVTKKTIAAGQTGNISINEDGTYYIRVFFNVKVLGVGEPKEILGAVDPITDATAILLAGATKSVKVKMIIE